VSFEPGMKHWMCNGGWEWWTGGRWMYPWCEKDALIAFIVSC